LKVLYFLTNYPYYSETFISAEIDQLGEAGHDVVICNFTFASKDQIKVKTKIVNNTMNPAVLLMALCKNVLKGQSLFFNGSFWRAVFSSCVRYPEYTLKYIFMLISADYMLARVREENADIAVNHFLFKSTLAGSFISDKLKLPYHLRLHTKRYLYTERVLKILLQKACRVTAIAEEVKDYYESKVNTEIRIGLVRQSVDISYLTKLEATKRKTDLFKIVAIGRLIKKKGFEQLIEAFSKIDESFKNRSSISIYGDGPERENIQRAIERFGLESHIKLEGKKEHKSLMNVLLQAELLVVPSIELERDIDGIPTVIIEAMVLKTTVLAYDTGSISEVVLPYKTGFLVPANDVSQLTEQMSNLILNNTKLLSVIEEAHDQALVKYKHTLANELTLDTD
jgi:colanic acid/amylovoran biosynthesis glycosyltransferase